MADSIESLDFTLECDGGGCHEQAVWVAYPGVHRHEYHDADSIVPHLVCDSCYNKLMNASGLVCMHCRNQGLDMEAMPLGEYYSKFVKLEEVGKHG